MRLITSTDIISAQHFWTGGLEMAGPGCYDAVAIARTAGFRNAGYEPASVMRRLSLNRSEPAKKSGQNIPKNRCRTTVAERMVETLSGTALYRDQVGLFKARPGRLVALRAQQARESYRPNLYRQLKHRRGKAARSAAPFETGDRNPISGP